MNQTTNKDLNQSEDKKVQGKRLLLLFFTVFIDLVGFGLIIPLMPTYAQQFHASAFQVGLLVSAYSLMQFIFTPFWGRLSDQIGRKPVLLISLTASTLGYLIWGWSAALPMLFLSRLVAGFGNANIAVAQAYIADVTTPEGRAKGMGMVGAAFGLGFILGPAIGGFFVQFGLPAIGFLAAGISFFDLILTALLLPEPDKLSHAGADRFPLNFDFYKRTLLDSRLRLSLAIFFISTFAFANMEATLVLLTQSQFGFTPKDNSLMFTFVGVIIVLVQGGGIHRLAKKYGEKKLITAGSLLTAIGLLCIPYSYKWWVLAPLTLLAIGSGINTPSNQSMLSKSAPRETVGGVLGVGQSLSTLGRIIGPAVGCFAFGKFASAVPYQIGAVAMVVALLISLRLPDP